MLSKFMMLYNKPILHDLRLQTCQLNNLMKASVPFKCHIGKTNYFLAPYSYAMKTIMLVTYVGTTKKHKFYDKCLMNLTYQITLITSMRDCSFWTLSNCVTYYFTITTLFSLLNI